MNSTSGSVLLRPEDFGVRQRSDGQFLVAEGTLFTVEADTLYAQDPGEARRLAGKLPTSHRILAAPTGLLAAQQIGQPTGCDGDQPAPRVVRDSVVRPLGCGRQHCLLYGVLGGVEIAVAADHGTENLRRQLTQQALETSPPFDRLRAHLAAQHSSGGSGCILISR